MNLMIVSGMFVCSSFLSDILLEMSVVRCVGGVCDMCMCLARAGWEVLGVSG